MMRSLKIFLLICFQIYAGTKAAEAADAKRTHNAVTVSQQEMPQYDKHGALLFPVAYRKWIYLSSGLDMDYNPAPRSRANSTFDNVFVNPGAYEHFLKKGSWPEKTVLVLETRVATSKGSINTNGHYQSTQTTGYEVHVKDQVRFRDTRGWAFFEFDQAEPGAAGRLFEKSTACYSCHEQHGTVDTTFVQFYPTLLSIAEKKGTLSQEHAK
jgi:cytochrome c553